MSKRGNYLIVQEDILRDDKIRDLIEARGYEGLGIYISLLTLMRNYSDTGYMVPWNEVRKIARWDLLIGEEELKGFIQSCIKCDLFKQDDSFFWSERRKNALEKQDELSEKQREGAMRTNEKLYGKRYSVQSSEQ